MMNDDEVTKAISRIAAGRDPYTGIKVGQNGIQIDPDIAKALRRASVELRRLNRRKIDLNDDDMELFKRLQNWKIRKAQKLGIPAPRIAPVGSLVEVAMSRPRSMPELEDIKGLKEKRLRDHGEDILSTVDKYMREKKAAAK